MSFHREPPSFFKGALSETSASSQCRSMKISRFREVDGEQKLKRLPLTRGGSGAHKARVRAIWTAIPGRRRKPAIVRGQRAASPLQTDLRVLSASKHVVRPGLHA